jgi:hypothetical protein
MIEIYVRSIILFKFSYANIIEGMYIEGMYIQMHLETFVM